jgi:hypothetical protein
MKGELANAVVLVSTDVESEATFLLSHFLPSFSPVSLDVTEARIEASSGML